jgi:hypothetical protein
MQPAPSSPPADTYMLSHPEPEEDQNSPNTGSRFQPTNKELYDALMSPAALFSALLRQDVRFASSITYPAENTDISILAFLDSELALKVDKWYVEYMTEHVGISLIKASLVWHRFYNPSIPHLVDLHSQLSSYRPGAAETPGTTLLIAILFLIALDIPTDRLRGHKHLQSILRSIVFDVGQQVLLANHSHIHALLALVVMTDYLPLGLVSTRKAAPGAIFGRTYLTCAKRMALHLGLDTAHVKLDADSHEPDQLSIEASACLLWCRIRMTEIQVYSDSDHPAGPLKLADPSIKASLDAVRKVVETRSMPAGVMNAYLTVQANHDEWETVMEITRCGKRHDHVKDLIDSHDATCQSLRQLVQSWAHGRSSQGVSEKAYALNQISNMSLDHHRLNILGLAMWTVMMAAAHPNRAPAFSPDEVVQVTDDVIRHLRSHSENDPNRPVERIFLETYGRHRLRDEQDLLVQFISTADLRLNGIPHTMPTRQVATSVLFVCKDMVEGNAARYKGWGSLHELTDTILIVFESCAQKIESMSRQGTAPNAIAEGNLHAASAKMIRSLRRIMEQWKRNIAESEHRKALEASNASKDGPTTIESTTSDETGPMLTANSLDWADDDEFFTQWSSWPTFDDLDFTQLFDTDPSSQF